jgi:hypothetical protein
VRRIVLVPAGGVALAITLYPYTLLPASALLATFSALTGVTFAIALVFGRRVVVTFAIGFFMAEYALALVVRDAGIDPLAPVVAASCLLVVEAVDLGHAPDFPERAVWARRASLLLVTLGGAVVVSTLALVVAHGVGAGHPAFFVFGAASALGSVGAAVLMARRLLA